VADTGRIAAIDVGTNSVHMVVADVDAQGFTVVATDKEVVRLGEGSAGMDRISAPAIERGVAAMVRMGHIADGLGADVRAVATSAVREATNRDEFLEAVRDATGVDVEVVSGAEEARLIHLGVSRSLDLRHGTVLVVDIGGGSTEFCLARDGELEIAQSIKVGAVRLTDLVLPEGRVTTSGIAEVRNRVRSAITHVVREIARIGAERTVLSSGTSESVARMVAALRDEPEPAGFNGFSFSVAELDDVVDRILGLPTPKERTRMQGLEPRRADIIVAGVLILQEVVSALGLERLEYSTSALREGVLLDTAVRRGLAGAESTDSSVDSVHRLARRCSVDLVNAEHVARLAERILQATGRSDAASLRALRAAALLAECGKAVAYARYHIHSHYIISHADLAGFTDAEIEVIGLVVRYHRKSVPRDSHDGFARLSATTRQQVELLGAVLRLATALNRAHDRSIGDVTGEESDGRLELRAHRVPGASVSVDTNIRAALDRVEPLAGALNVPVAIVVAAPVSDAG
jgi:exopolyphosphatase/guanosine-5'-triphosphate,3'-diphosphate pyrophosphatase